MLQTNILYFNRRASLLPTEKNFMSSHSGKVVRNFSGWI